MTNSNTLQSYRKMFPILNNKIQLSSCSQSALSIPVLNAIQDYQDSILYDGMDWMKWMEKVDHAKELFAKIIGANKDEIAIMASVSDVISSIASTFSYDDQRNELLTTDIDFPTVGHIFLAQERFGAKIRFIPSENNYIPLDYYEKYITENTLLTVVSHASYYNGYTQNIKEISKIAQSKGSLLLVDAYQSTGCVPIDVKEMGVDILVSGTQKYLLGIPGIAFVYIKKELVNQISPRVTGWFGQNDIFAFDIKGLSFANNARRFETGTPPVINAYAAQAAFSLLLEVGLKPIFNHLEKLSTLAIQYGQEKGLSIVSPLSNSLKNSTTSFLVGNGSEVEKKMKDKGFILSARKDVIRLAPHFYNTEDDIKLAIDELQLISTKN